MQEQSSRASLYTIGEHGAISQMLSLRTEPCGAQQQQLHEEQRQQSPQDVAIDVYDLVALSNRTHELKRIESELV